MLNADGKEKSAGRSNSSPHRALQGDISLQTYIAYLHQLCPDVVQVLNIIALLNPHVTHEMVDGALNQEEVDALVSRAVSLR